MLLTGCTKSPQVAKNERKKKYFGAWIGAEDDFFAIKIVRQDSLVFKVYILEALLENITLEDCDSSNLEKTFLKYNATPIKIDSIAIKKDSLYLRTAWYYVGADNKRRIQYQAILSESMLFGEMQVDWYVDALRENYPETKPIRLSFVK